MAAWNSSSLAFSDHNSMRHSGGLMKNLTERISKQHLVEHKMFGAKRGHTQANPLKIGKRFKKQGKGVIKNIGNTARSVSPKGGGISPSIEEFDKMMGKVAGKNSTGFSGKKMFSRKQFG
jgi:hypothetical protein